MRKLFATVLTVSALSAGCGASGPLEEACAEVGDRWACRDAYLFGADLSEADLSRVNLNKADLSKAYLSTAILPEGWREALEAAELI